MEITQQLMESRLVLRHYKSKIFVCCLLVLVLQGCASKLIFTNMESCVDNQQFITLHKKIENKQELSKEEHTKYQDLFKTCQIEALTRKNKMHQKVDGIEGIILILLLLL